MRNRNSLLTLLVALLFALASFGCAKEEAKKAKKQEAKKEEKQPAAKPQKEEPKPEVKKEEATPEVKKEEATPEVKKEEAKKEEPAQPEEKAPTAQELLEKATAAYAGVTPDAAKLAETLKVVGEATTTYPDSDPAYRAYALGARIRTEYVVAGQAEPALLAQIMAADGKLQAGQQATPEQQAQYCKALATEFQAKAKVSPKAEEGKPLEAAAALLNYLHDETLEKAGKMPGNELVLPAEWAGKAGDQSGKALDGEPSKSGEPAEPDVAEKKQEEVNAETGEATDKPAADQPTAEKKAPFVKQAGADVSTLLALATGDNAVTLQARTLVLSRMAAALDAADKGSTDYVAWWQNVAAGTGKVLCAACGQLDQVPEEHLAEVLFLAGNSGLVCKAAQAEAAQGTPVAEAVAKLCAGELGLTEADLELATPLNALALRFYVLAGQMLNNLPANAQADPFYPRCQAAAQKVQGHLLKKVALLPTVPTWPADQWEAMKEKLVLQSDLAAGAPSWNFMPLEMAVIDENGVFEAMRPVADATAQPFGFVEAKEGLRLPGKLVADVKAIETELKARDEKFKEEKREWDKRNETWVDVVTIKGVEFKKPDFSIPSVVAAAKKLAEKAGSLEPEVFPYLLNAETAVVNHKRPEWPEFKDTVGKAALYGVDQATPALLFKRVVDSLYYADFKDTRLVKGSGDFDTLPTVYFTEKFVADEVLDTTYKRPVLVYVTDDGTVRFYPPTDRTHKGKMKATRSPRKRDTKWPGKYRSVEDPRNPDPVWNLFMSYTKAGSQKFADDVVGIASEMKKKWDNGNVFYIKAEEKAPSGIVVKVADLIAHLPEETPIAALDKAFPGYTCDAEQAPERCLTNIVVLFPDVEIPYLPGKKKVKEVERKVYCDKDDIARKIKAKRGAIKFCYDPELQKNPNLKGKVVFNFTIGANGRITSISPASDGLGNSKVVNCTMKVLKRINFRRPIGGECKIRYPYVFKP